MNIAICDDTRTELKYTSEMVLKYFQIKKIAVEISLFNNAHDLLNSNEDYDLYFLDIILGKENGIDVARDLLKRKGKVGIFLMSTSNAYILDGYKVRAIRYFLKPIIWADFCYELNEALNYLNTEDDFINVESHPGEKIYLDSVLYLEKTNRYVKINTLNNIYTSAKNISEWYELLEKKHFIMPYKGIIVNLSNILKIESKEIILKNSNCIPISRKYAKVIKEKFNNYVMNIGKQI